MKRVLIVFLCLIFSVSLFAQSGLGHGQAVKQTTPNPTSVKKTCSYCGIEMGNITYAWQHETWCPYYKSRTSSSSSSSVSANNVAAGVAAIAVGSAIGNALSDWLNAEPNGDYKRYTSSVPGHTLDYMYDERSGGQKVPKYVVLRDSKKGKLGVWENAWTYTETSKADKNYGKMTDYPGEWKIKPKYDFINLRYSGLDSKGLREDCVAIVGLKSGKGDDAPMKYGIVEANIGWGYGNELIPVKYTGCVTTNSVKGGGPLMVIMGNEGKDGKKKWGVWKIGPKRKPNQFDKMEAFAVLPEQFEDVWIYLPNYIVAVKEGKCGLYNADGENLIPHEYSSMVVSKATGMVSVQKEEGGKFGVLDSHGNSVLPFEYERIFLCNGGTVLFGSNGLYGALLPNGEKVPIEYTNIAESFWTRLSGEKVISLIVEKDGVCYYISNSRLIPVQAPVDFAAGNGYYNKLVKDGQSFSSWYDNKTAKLKEEFMKKGEFEKEADYKARIEDPANLGKFLSSRLQAPLDEYLKSYPLKEKDGIVRGQYDTENECFPIHLVQSPWDVIRIPVPIDAAPEFKERAYVNLSTYELELRNDFPAIKVITTEIKRKTYKDEKTYFTTRVGF